MVLFSVIEIYCFGRLESVFPIPGLPTCLLITTVFVDTRLWKTKHSRKRFRNFYFFLFLFFYFYFIFSINHTKSKTKKNNAMFRQSCVLLTDRIEIHQSQPLVWPSNHLYVMLSGCDWWISIRSVNNTQDWRKFWKRFRGFFVFQSRVSTKTVVRQVVWQLFAKFSSCSRKFFRQVREITSREICQFQFREINFPRKQVTIKVSLYFTTVVFCDKHKCISSSRRRQRILLR